MDIKTAGSGTAATKATKTGEVLFTDEDLADTAEHTSSTVDVNKIRHKSISIKLETTGSITDYFVVIKIQSSDTDVAASFRTIVEVELEDDDALTFDINDSRRYVRITAIADEGGALSYITINATLDALGG